MRALITGVTGMDGHHLSELLLEKGYEVYGVVRRISAKPKIPQGVKVLSGDSTDPSLTEIIKKVDPDEIYNLAGQSYVLESFKVPQSTFETNTFGCINALEGARATGAKFYQASTSEMFGATPPPQNEKTPFYPRSPYGVSKLAAHWLTVNYREAYSLFACNGILFNHESPLRGHEFLSQKVATAAARISLGLQKRLKLGNLDSKRDWGHAKDYVKGMWLLMQQEDPKDLVFATGEAHSVRDFVETAFNYVGLNWEDYVDFDESMIRPTEVDVLKGDPSEAEKIGWTREYSFEALIHEMVYFAVEES